MALYTQSKTVYQVGPITVQTTKGVYSARLIVNVDDCEHEVVLNGADIDDLRDALRFAREDLVNG